MKTVYTITLALGMALALSACKSDKSAKSSNELLNVSYDPTRELYADYNKLFAAHWKEKTGKEISVNQSHGGSGKQARSVMDGLEADVVTLALAADIDAIAEKSKTLPSDWQSKLPEHSAPYTSTIVFVVRKGNPKGIRDWNDLVRPDIKVVTPNPKTSGGARWNYLAAWAYADKAFGKDEAKVMDYMKKLFANVPVLDSGARGATTTFAERNIGDVFLSWENEAYLIQNEFKDKTEIVYPSISILAEPPVAVVEKNATKHGTSELAKAYLEYLYTLEAQDIIGKHFYRPRDAKIAEKYAKQFPKLELVTIEGYFGGWAKAQKTHFDNGGTFDQVNSVK